MHLGTAKLGCFSIHKWVFLFSFLYVHACYAQKEKYAKKIKVKKNQNAFNMIVSMFLGDVGVIRGT